MSADLPINLSPLRVLCLLVSLPIVMLGCAQQQAPESNWNSNPGSESVNEAIPMIRHRQVQVEGVNIFYREAGPTDAPTVLLLHGFPSSSHQYRSLMEALGAELRLIAPDYPGSGYSDTPRPKSAGGSFDYSFETLTDTIEAFCKELQLDHFILYMFDFGGPVGMRLAERHPGWVAGVIVQNANIYQEGLSEPARQVVTMQPGMPGAESKLNALLQLEATRGQYQAGASHPELLSPDAWTLDQHFLDQPHRKKVQIDLLLDYHNNIERYPEWQTWLRKHQPPALILWGRNDPIFIEPGAHAYLRDLPNAELHLFATGHFALEESLADMAPLIQAFAHNIFR